jgi:hypothetical protein
VILPAAHEVKGIEIGILAECVYTHHILTNLSISRTPFEAENATQKIQNYADLTPRGKIDSAYDYGNKIYI